MSKPRMRTCAQCKTRFQLGLQANEKTRYCSKRCGNAAMTARKKAERAAARPVIRCGHCGNPFKPRAITGVYCSKACQNVGKNAKARAEARERMSKTRHCEHCGDEYLPVRSHQRFCGPKCKDNAQRARLLADGICTTCKSKKALPEFTECRACKDKREIRRNTPMTWAEWMQRDVDRVAKRKAQIEMERGYTRFLCEWTATLDIADGMPWKREIPTPTMETRA